MNAGKSKLPPSTSWFTEIRRDSIALVAVSLIFAVVLISQVFGPLKSLTGDEPHYLVVAHSIITDGDVELWDDYNGDKAWKEFYTGELLPHYSPGLKGSYSSRIIGLGVYQAPFYFLGKVFGNVIFWSRLGMALLFSALISMLYLLCRDLGIERKASLYASLTALATVPLVFYSYAIYPEVPAALLSILSIRIMLKWDQISILNPLFSGLCLALLPWLGLKYSVIALVLGIGIVVMIFRTKAPLLRSLGYFALFPLIFLLLIFIYLYLCYGSFSPAVIYTGVGENAKTTAGVNMQSYGSGAGGIFRMFMAYFIDQRDGLLFFSPVYVFGIAGLFLMLKKVPASRTISLLFIIFLFAYAFTHWGSGHAPSCRPVVSVLWVLVIGLAYSFQKISSFFSKLILLVTLSVSVCFTFLGIIRNFLFYHVMLGHTETHGNNFLESISTPFRTATLFPNLINPRDIHPFATVAMLTVFLAIILLLVRFMSKEKKETRKENYALQAGPLMIAAGLPVLLFSIGFLNAELISPEEMQGGGTVRLVFKDNNTYGYEPGVAGDKSFPGFWMKGQSQAEVNIICAEKPEKLEIELLSLKPQTIILKVEGVSFKVNFEKQKWQRVEIPDDLAALWRNRYLFRMQVTSPEGYRPADHGEEDNRNLGCRVIVNSRNKRL